MQKVTVAIVVSGVLLLTGCVTTSSEVRSPAGAAVSGAAYQVSGSHADSQYHRGGATHHGSSHYRHHSSGRRGTEGYGRFHRSPGSDLYSSPRFGTSRYGSYRSRHKMLRHHYYRP